jgi:hypothetical protein
MYDMGDCSIVSRRGRALDRLMNHLSGDDIVSRLVLAFYLALGAEHRDLMVQ